MGNLVIEDLTGNINAIAFTKEFDKYKDKLLKGKVMKFKAKAKIEERDDDAILDKQLVIREVSELKALNKVFIKVKTIDEIEKVEQKLANNIGGTQIMFYIEKEKKLTKSKYLVNLNDELRQIFGNTNISV